MPETMTTMDNRTLLRRTLLTVGVLVGANVVVVGLLMLFAVSIVSHALAPPTADTDKSGGDGKVVPAGNVHGAVTGAPPKIPPQKIPGKP
jgi:hypothetical protein